MHRSLIWNRGDPDIVLELLKEMLLAYFQSDFIGLNIEDSDQTANRW